MAKYFNCVVKYDKIQEDGLVKKTKETYLVDAMSYTEAESRFIEEITPFMSGEFDIDIKKFKIADVLESDNADADKFYLAKVALVTLDEKTMSEKRIVTRMLVKAKDWKEANNVLEDACSKVLSDTEVEGLDVTAILDVFKYNGKA